MSGLWGTLAVVGIRWVLAALLLVVSQALLRAPFAARGRWRHLALSVPIAAVGLTVFPRASAVGAMLLPRPPWSPLAMLPSPLDVAVGVLCCDLVLYVAHRLQHTIPALWAFHEVHHLDPEPDLATAWHRHPVAVAIEAWMSVFASLLLGIPLAAWVVYGTIQLPNSLVQHAHWPLPPSLERALRWVFVTPEIHRLHHARAEVGRRSNFAFVFSFWDRALGSWCVEEPGAVRPCGVEGRRSAGPVGTVELLALPYVGGAGSVRRNVMVTVGVGIVLVLAPALASWGRA